jgi:hypothetical protein
VPASVPSTRRRWLLAALAVWSVLLVSGVLPGLQGLTRTGAFDLRSGSRVRAVLAAVATGLLLETLRFVPVGALIRVLLVDASARRWRGTVAWLAALGAAALLLAVHVRAVPGASDLVLPWLGASLGVAAVAWWEAPPRTRRRAAFWTLGLTAGAAAATAILLAMAIEAQPRAFAATPLSSDDKRRVYRLLKGRNPRKIPPGETRTLELTGHDLDVLLAWGLPVVLGPEAKGRAALAPSEDATVEASLPLRFLGQGTRFLNLEAGARVRIQHGVVDLQNPRLRVGRVEVPGLLLRLLTPAARALVVTDRRVRPLLRSVQELRVDRDRVSTTYARMELPAGLMADALWGEDSGAGLRAAVRECALRVLAQPPAEDDGDARFGTLLRTAFAWAAEGGAGEGAVARNRAAILALGILRGHTKLERFTGPVLEEADWDRAPGLREVTLRGRDDWTKHFLVSAALTVLSSDKPSDEAGLFKEELDADGGSGFSFADLAADRSGTTFALVATRDEGAARAVQERLRAGFAVSDFFPPAADLPEGIDDAAFQARYGGVGGPLYLATRAEVERRVAGCAAYREAVSAAPGSPGN